MHVQTFGIVGAFGPGNDVRGAQQLGLANTGERATILPAVHQRAAEDVLADPPTRYGLRLRGAQHRHLVLEALEGSGGQRE